MGLNYARTKIAIQLERDKKNDCRGRITMDICLAFRWRLLHWRAAFGFRGEKVLVSVFEVRSLTYPPLSSVSVCLCFPSVFLSLSLPRMPLLAGGFVCFMPQREPSCTDVLPGLQFLAFA